MDLFSLLIVKVEGEAFVLELSRQGPISLWGSRLFFLYWLDSTREAIDGS